MFQMTFAIITPALVVGAYAERVKFSGMLLFSLLWLLLVYCPVAHWVWGDGWLQKMGLMDFAGGTVVHLNAGMAALVCALVIGRRKGFPDTAMPPHNMTMTVTGACMLWVGWFGFNAGSNLEANGYAALAVLNTFIATAAAGFSWAMTEWVTRKKASLLGMASGLGITFYYMATTQVWLRGVFGVTSPIADNMWFGINPISAGVFGVPLGFAVIIIVSLLTKAPGAKVQELIEHVRYPQLKGDIDTRAT
jgi:Na+(H+)/acetate symporter ActP